MVDVELSVRTLLSGGRTETFWPHRWERCLKGQREGFAWPISGPSLSEAPTPPKPTSSLPSLPHPNKTPPPPSPPPLLWTPASWHQAHRQPKQASKQKKKRIEQDNRAYCINSCLFSLPRPRESCLSNMPTNAHRVTHDIGPTGSLYSTCYTTQPRTPQLLVPGGGRDTGLQSATE